MPKSMAYFTFHEQLLLPGERDWLRDPCQVESTRGSNDGEDT